MPLIHQIPTKDTIRAEDLMPHSAGGLVYACDFYVVDAEKGESVPAGYQTDWLINVDHHAATDRMRERISSTTLAIAHVKQFGPVSGQAVIIINHADCDSVLGSRILSGDLEALDIYNVAAVAADHTGEENEIADLLQALDIDGFKDHNISYRNLQLYLDGGINKLEPAVQKALERRHSERCKASELVTGGKFTDIGCLSYSVLTEKIAGELFLPFLEKAYVIMTASPHGYISGHWNIKVRLGNNAPKGLSLKNIDLTCFDSGYDGRWNAGSNKRANGTKRSPDVYASNLAIAINSQLELLTRVT